MNLPILNNIKNLIRDKVNKSDIVNNLTTGGIDKALSAEQGKVLKNDIVSNTNKIGDLQVSVNEQGGKIGNLENNTSFINQSMLGTNRSCYKYLGSRNTNGITSNKKWKISLPKNKSINFSVILQASWVNADATGILKKTFSYGDMGTWQSIKESEYELIQGNIQTEFSISDIIAENNECFILISSVVNISNNPIYVTIHSDTENRDVINLITISECYGTDARVIPQPRYKYSEKTEIFCTASTGWTITENNSYVINGQYYIRFTAIRPTSFSGESQVCTLPFTPINQPLTILARTANNNFGTYVPASCNTSRERIFVKGNDIIEVIISGVIV